MDRSQRSLIIASFLLSTLSTNADSDFSTGWETRYVNEGRDDSAGEPIHWAELNHSWSQLHLSAFGVRDHADLEEYHSSVWLSHDWDLLNLAVGINYVAVASDQDDLEYLFECAGGSQGFEWSLSAVHSRNMDGQFLLLSLHRPFAWMQGQLRLIPALHQGFDFGYRTPDFDGPSHLEIDLSMEYQITGTLSLIGHVAHSWAQSDLRREGGQDLTWCGLGLVVDF